MSKFESPTPKPHLRLKTIYLETFGCQMNELDSELVRGQLTALGYRFANDQNKADVILYNTCSVREQAENKVWSRLGLLGLRKKEGEQFVLGVIGCMAEREGAAMIRRFPQVDLMCGPGELDKLPRLIDNAFKTGAIELADRVALQGNNSRRSSTLAAAEDNLEMLDLSRAFDPDRSSPGAGRSAYVRITRGCNKFCTYCVVPYTRGAEVHRPPDSIVDECKKLADQGVIEITLLGQTVNHYVYAHGAAVSGVGLELPQIGPGAAAFARNGAATRQVDSHASPRRDVQGAQQRTTSFADLLRRIHDEVPAIQRLRFVTSFPRDFGDDILRVMAQSPRICKYLHVPAQSGSDRILKLMNRGYTAQQYVEFIDRARAIVPDVCIAGDFIVGFPTESDEDFEQTKQLLRRVRYKNSFIFKYSPRPGTTAIDRFEDDVPEVVKRKRNNDLLDVQSEISADVHAAYVGRTVDVFVEQVSNRSAKAELVAGTDTRVELRRNGKPLNGEQGNSQKIFAGVQFSGRTEGDLVVIFEPHNQGGSGDLVGRIVRVKITESAPLYLRGSLAGRVETARFAHHGTRAALD